MPYVIVERDGEYCVFRKGDAGPVGKPLGCHEEEGDAQRQLRALYANVPDAREAYARDRCMRCAKPPMVDVLWAEGAGRAWFCQEHFDEWRKEHEGDISATNQVTDGVVPAKWGARDAATQEALGEEAAEGEAYEFLDMLAYWGVEEFDALETYPAFASTGSKVHLAPWILANAPAKGTYVEPFCVPGETLVRTARGWTPIKDVCVGEEVLTHDGVSVVNEVMSRQYEGEMVDIHVQGDYRPLSATPEHPVLCVRRETLRTVKQSWWSGRVPEGAEPFGDGNPGKSSRQKRLTIQRGREALRHAEWVSAGELEPGDLVVMHFSQHATSRTSWRVSPRERQRHNTVAGVPMDYDVCRVVGLYLAEGCLNVDRGVIFSLHRKEEGYIAFLMDTMQRVFGIRGRVVEKPASQGVEVRFYGVQAAEFFAQFGDSAHTKHVPDTWANLPIKKRAQLVRGLMEGDGYLHWDANEAVLATVSEVLARDAFDILVGMGALPSIRRSTYTTTLPNGCDCDTTVYLVSIGGQGRRAFAKLFGERIPASKRARLGINLRGCGVGNDVPHAVLRRVRSVERRPWAGIVYNLSVLGANSFVTPIATVHNCGSAAVLFAREPQGREVLNDLNPDIYAVYKLMKADPEGIAEKLRGLEWRMSQQSFLHLKSRKLSSDLERAHRALVIAWMTWGSIGRYIKTTPVNIPNRIKHLGQVASRLKDVVLTSQDYRKCLKRWDSADTFFYLDPPYPVAGDNLFHKNTLPTAQEIYDAVKGLKGDWIMSLNDSPEHRALFTKGMHCYRVTTSYRKLRHSGGTPHAELIVANYLLPKLRYHSSSISSIRRLG